MRADTVFVRGAIAPVGSPYPRMLIPADDTAATLIGKVATGEIAAVRVMRGRSLPQHRLFWALLTHVAEASKFETAERLLVALKIRLGRYDLCAMPSGKVVPVPDSISFEAMTQDDFQQFFDEALGRICDEVIPGTDAAALIAEVQAMIGHNYTASRDEPAERPAGSSPTLEPTPALVPSQGVPLQQSPIWSEESFEVERHEKGDHRIDFDRLKDDMIWLAGDADHPAQLDKFEADNAGNLRRLDEARSAFAAEVREAVADRRAVITGAQ